MLADILDADIEEQFAYFERLNKSADPMTRERAQAELDRLATVDLEKVGPKGYIHGWIFVGAPGVGGRVYHPQHGHGTITRHGKRTIGVRFDSGKEHAFEHGARHERVGETSGHFGQRLDGRTGKPVKAPEVAVKPAEVPEVKVPPRAVKPVEHVHDAIDALQGDASAAEPHGERGLSTLDELHETAASLDEGTARPADAASVLRSLGRRHSGSVAAALNTAADRLEAPKAPEVKKPEAPSGAPLRQTARAAGIKPGDRIRFWDSVGGPKEGTLERGRVSGEYQFVADGGGDPFRFSSGARYRMERLDGPAEAKKPEAKPKAPKAPQERKPGEARRGDLVLVHSQSLEATRDGRGRTAHRLSVAQVTSVTRDGKIKEYLNADSGPGARPYRVSNDARSTQYHVLPQEKFDTEAALAAYRERTWTPGGTLSKPYASLAEAREAMKPHLREEKPKAPEVPERPKPAASVAKPMPAPASTEMQERLAHFTPAQRDSLHTEAQELRDTQGVTAAGAWRAVIEGAEQDRLSGRGRYASAKPPEPEQPMRSAREEVRDASGMRNLGEGEHPRGTATDYLVQQHPAVKRAEQAVFRSAGGYDGTPDRASVKALHDAYRTAGAVRGDALTQEAWNKLGRPERDVAVTDPAYGDTVLAHLAATHRATRVRNDPAASAEAKKSASETVDKTYRDVYSIQAITGRREREDARRAAARDRINAGDSAAAVDLLPPKADDRVTRRIAEAITPQVDPTMNGKRLQTATAVRNAEVEVARTRMAEEAMRRRFEARRSISPNWDGHRGVAEALDAEHRRNADEWGQATKAREAAQERLAAAKELHSSAEAEHKVMIGKQHAQVMDQMRAEFDKLGETKSTEGKDIAREAGVPRTITRLTGQEKELAREVNKRADILSEGRSKSDKFNRQADIVEATHARLSGTLHPEVQDRLDALYDQARDQRGVGPNTVYRENLNEAIERWNLFQRAKNGVAPRGEDEMAHRHTLALQVQRDEPELAARIRAGNVEGGAPQAVESQQAESALPIPGLPKPRASREYKEPAENTLEPGAKVSWTHHHEDGTTTERTGRVWSKVPKLSNAQDAAWVTPDERLASDPYSAVVVHQDQRTKKGRPVRFVSHDNDKSHSGSLGAAAARAADRHRVTGKAFRPIDPLIEAAIEHALSAAA